MKKITFILALMFAFAISEAQTVALTPLTDGDTYRNVGTDYTLTNTTARTFTLTAGQDYMTAQDLIINLDSASGNHTNVAVAFYGKKSDYTAAWTQIGSTINWAGTTSDTTITISNTTENGYRLYKWTLTGTGTGTTTISNMEFKQWFGIP
jgi:hypothetical protein